MQLAPAGLSDNSRLTAALDATMGPGKMLEECCDLIQSFDAKVMTVDAHAMEQLGDTDAEDAAPHKVFMQQVLYGCVRYKKFLH